MKPEYSLVSMQNALERAAFRVVRDRSRYARQFYIAQELSPTSPDRMPQAQMPDLDSVLHSIEENEAIRSMAEATGMTMAQAEGQIAQTCTEALEDSGFPYLYAGVNIEALRGDFLRLARICYLVGFEAGSSSQCEMFADIVDVALAELNLPTSTAQAGKNDMSADKIMAALYFTSAMEEGAHFAEFHRSVA